MNSIFGVFFPRFSSLFASSGHLVFSSSQLWPPSCSSLGLTVASESFSTLRSYLPTSFSLPALRTKKFARKKKHPRPHSLFSPRTCSSYSFRVPRESRFLFPLIARRVLFFASLRRHRKFLFLPPTSSVVGRRPCGDGRSTLFSSHFFLYECMGVRVT